MKKTEICLHCNDDYIPKRRGVQKFCSKSCKSRYWYLKQNKKELKLESETGVVTNETKTDKMSWGGVGNSAVGTVLGNAATSLLTAGDNKPATKKDIEDLKSLISDRYLPVNNLGVDGFGRRPFYDVETGNVEFFYQ
jgi:hypothetical protein